MRTLVYKRTHKGDPDRKGRFGITDCMGSLRSRDFDAVIGVGGIGSQARAEGIGGKVNWIGVGSRKEPLPEGRGPLVTFDHFVLFEEKGQDFRAIAPTLARRMYSRDAPRFLFKDDFNEAEQAEIGSLLAMAKTASPSAAPPRRQSHARSGRCGSRRC